ncbi:UPF0538 protein C2orf76 homolog [Orbicella faveolata]|uniref:UPF0538 protein C2orf76 homolog n=1 Tax=Orbicella faveolata TaxID=48498 RepID=UPI0009E30A04|nr:UPF0538 protein C2orf76 homolog [Orbicella faveolata]
MDSGIGEKEAKSTGAIITVRLIRSFEYRNIKYVVFKDVPLEQTVQHFMNFVISEIKKRPDVPPPFRNFAYDTMKIQHKAHGAKTSNPVIVLEDDQKLILTPDHSLSDSGIENETEISFFKKEDYERYKANPEMKW